MARRRKKETPPKPLVERTKPSRRHPQGQPRCQRWKMREGKFWQCPKPAREGFSVCGVHGAGFPKRERDGETTNPKLGALTTGEKAQPATAKALLEAYPALRALYDAQINDDAFLLDFRPQLALAKVLAFHYVQTADLNSVDTSFGKKPPALAALEAVSRAMEIADRFQKLEREDRVVILTNEQLRRFYKACAFTLHTFVPEEHTKAAQEHLRNGILNAVGSPLSADGAGSSP